MHFAFFRHTEAEVRLRILEGRRSRLEERLDGVRTALARTRERLDSYTLELQRHGLESVEREVRWLNELIATERRASPAGETAARAGTSRASSPGRETDRKSPGRQLTTRRTKGASAMGSVRVAIVGVGNCATSLVQGVHYYKDADPGTRVPGLMHVKFGDYHVGDVEFVAAFDVDAKKVGRDLSEAIVASREQHHQDLRRAAAGHHRPARPHLRRPRRVLPRDDRGVRRGPGGRRQGPQGQPGRRPGLLPARGIGGGRPLLRPVRDRRQGRVRQRAAGVHRLRPRRGRRSSPTPASRSSATTSSPRSARPSRTA